MTFVAVTVVLLLVLIFWVVFVPVYIRINTDRHLYTISQAGTLTISFHPGEDRWMKMRFFGINIDTTGKKSTSPVATKKFKKGKRRIKKSVEAWIYLFHGIARSFHCKRLVCSIDFDDVVLNAQLVPVMYFLNRGSIQLSVNFTMQRYMDLVIQARINQMIWTFIRFLIKK